MTQDEIEAIAQRPTCCKPFGEAVTLSRAERDALVALARRYAWLRDNLDGIAAANWGETGLVYGGVALDAAVDAAMAKEQT